MNLIKRFPKTFNYARKIALTLALLLGTNLVVLLVTALTMVFTFGGSVKAPEWLSTWSVVSFLPIVFAFVVVALFGFGFAVAGLIRMWRNPA